MLRHGGGACWSNRHPKLTMSRRNFTGLASFAWLPKWWNVEKISATFSQSEALRHSRATSSRFVFSRLTSLSPTASFSGTRDSRRNESRRRSCTSITVGLRSMFRNGFSAAKNCCRSTAMLSMTCGSASFTSRLSGFGELGEKLTRTSSVRLFAASLKRCRSGLMEKCFATATMK